jgi:ClpX C4-type zinc finger
VTGTTCDRGGHKQQAADQPRVPHSECPAPMDQRESEEPRCSFCGATHQHRRLIAGPDVYVCHECVKELAAIVHEDPGTPAPDS